MVACVVSCLTHMSAIAGSGSVWDEDTAHTPYFCAGTPAPACLQTFGKTQHGLDTALAGMCCTPGLDMQICHTARSPLWRWWSLVVQ